MFCLFVFKLHRGQNHGSGRAAAVTAVPAIARPTKKGPAAGAEAAGKVDTPDADGEAAE